jgi:SAM-dependent methyltransferase
MTTKTTNGLRELLTGMRAAYSRGENAMEFARRISGDLSNSVMATLLAYDLQAGSYVAKVRGDPQSNQQWCQQLAIELAPYIDAGCSMLEVGCGEATTLAGVIHALPRKPRECFGFDISWSRCAEALGWLKSNDCSARLFVADLFSIPLADESVDVVYTSHSIEPNGGREERALAELLRVARRTVVLIEPLYELGTPEAQQRMRHHGYVRGLRNAASSLGGDVRTCRLLDYSSNPLNPSGVIVIQKARSTATRGAEFQCPLTATPLSDKGEAYYSEATGLAYPVLGGIPLLRPEHMVVASKLRLSKQATAH